MVQQVPELTMPVAATTPWAVTVLDWPEPAAEAEALAAGSGRGRGAARGRGPAPPARRSGCRPARRLGPHQRLAAASRPDDGRARPDRDAPAAGRERRATSLPRRRRSALAGAAMGRARTDR